MKDSIQKKRNHGIVVFEDSIKALSNFILPLAIALFPALKSGEFSGLLVTVGVSLAFFGLGIIYSLLAWLFKAYRIEDGVFTLNYGVFVKKNREIPISKINTVHEMQTLSQRLFKACTLKLDTGSSLLKETEVRLVVSLSDIALIKGLLKPAARESQGENISDTKASPVLVYKTRPICLIKMGLTSNAIFAGLALVLSLFQFLAEIFDEQLDVIISRAESYIKSTALKTTLEIFILLMLLLVVYSALSVLIAAVGSLIRYHDFRVFREEGKLVIQYGLIKKNSYSIAESKIHAIYMKQSFLRQMMGYASVLIESIGYGNEKGEEAILIPFIKLNEAQAIMRDILTDYPSPTPLARVPRRSFRRFLAGTLFFPLLLIIPISLFYPFGFISLALIPFFLISGILQFRNSGISQNNRYLFMGYGGFTRCYAHVKRTGIQAVIKKATPFQRAAGLFTLNISIQGTVFGRVISVKHLDTAVYSDLTNLI